MKVKTLEVRSQLSRLVKGAVKGENVVAHDGEPVGTKQVCAAGAS